MNLTVSAKKARILGVVGSALSIFLLLAPAVGGMVNLIGAVLILISVWSLSRHLKKHRIFTYFLAHALVLIVITVISSLTASYLLDAFESESISVQARLFQIALTLLPLISSFFFFKSYQILSDESDVKMFTVTAVVQLSFAAVASLLNIILIFSQSPLVASLGLLLTFAGFLVIPVLGTISYIMLSPTLLEYKSRT